MKKALFVGAALALAAVAVALAYQAAARDRDYRALLARGRHGRPRRPDLRRDRGLQRRHRAASRVDASPPPARRNLPAPGRARRSRAGLPRRRRARPDRHPTPRGARRRPLRNEAIRPGGRDLRPESAGRRPVGRRRATSWRSPTIAAAISTRRSRRSARRSRLNNRLADASYLLGLCLRDRRRIDRGARGIRKDRCARTRAHPRAGRACGPVRVDRPAAPKRSNNCR